MGNSRHYVEFNIAEKLQGSFVMQTMVGAPLRTRNEGQSRFNLRAPSQGKGYLTRGRLAETCDNNRFLDKRVAAVEGDLSDQIARDHCGSAKVQC